MELKHSLDASRKHNRELQEEVNLLLSGVQELSQKNLELETSLSEGEEKWNEMQEEADDLAMQLEVMEGNKNDVARLYNNQNMEMQTLYTVMERDKHVRQELTAKVRQTLQ